MLSSFVAAPFFSLKQKAHETAMNVSLQSSTEIFFHPGKSNNDEKMMDTAQSIREYGALVPAIARPLEEGGYELVSGHRRKRGCELAGLDSMPVIIRELDDDAATIITVDSNTEPVDKRWINGENCAILSVKDERGDDRAAFCAL